MQGPTAAIEEMREGSRSGIFGQARPLLATTPLPPRFHRIPPVASTVPLTIEQSTPMQPQRGASSTSRRRFATETLVKPMYPCLIRGCTETFKLPLFRDNHRETHFPPRIQCPSSVPPSHLKPNQPQMKLCVNAEGGPWMTRRLDALARHTEKRHGYKLPKGKSYAVRPRDWETDPGLLEQPESTVV